MVRLFNEILGQEVEVPEKPQRIISFSPALTESLFMLGLGESIAGVSAFCARPPEASGKRKVGSYNTVSYDLLDSLRPDLILTVTGYQRDFARQLAGRYPAYPLELPVSVAGIIDQVVKLGLVVGEQERARKLSSDLLRSLGAGRLTRPQKAYVEIDLGGPVSFGAHSYITDALHFLGSTTVFDDSRVEWLTPELERVRASDPDLIIYEAKMFSKFGQQDFDALIDHRSWTSLRAVTRGNCFLTPGPLDFLAHHGPSFVTVAVPWLASVLGRAGALA